jgi:FkbM family methyltransferase
MRQWVAHRVAAIAALLGPWWRFRVWARLAGSGAYASRPGRDVDIRRVRPHGYRMALHQSDWMERYALGAGRFYQDDLTALVCQQLRPGDTFVDVGANVGFVTLTAARCVGPTGRVYAFEAAPATAAKLVANVELNDLANVEVRALALGDREGSVSLVQDTAHHGTNYIDPRAGGSATVPMVRGDAVLHELSNRVLVKIDVEGAERLVLEGMDALMARPDTRFIVEICPEQLARFATRAEDVFALMARHGYVPHAVRLAPLGRRVTHRRLDGPQNRALYDVLFTR